MVTRPKILVLDEPTEGIQPSIIKDIGRAIRYLRHDRHGDPAGRAVSRFCRSSPITFTSWIAVKSSIKEAAETLDTPEARRHLTV